MAIKSLFIKGRVGYVGLDVSADSITAAQLEGVPKSKRFHVTGWSRVDLPVGVVHEGRILKPEKFSQGLQELFSKPQAGNLDGRHVILSLAEHQCYHKSFSIKRIGRTEPLVNLANREISQVVPYPIADMHWDWQLVLTEQKYSHVYALAVLKKVIEEYRQALRSVDMTMAVMEPQVISATRLLFESQLVAEPLVYLDVGAEETTVATIDQLGVHQSSVAEVGISSWVNELARTLKVEPQVALKVLDSVGLRRVKHEKAQLIQQAIMQGLQPVVREIEQHKTYYQYIHNNSDVPLQSLMLNGEGALVPGVGEALAGALGLTLRQVQSWAEFEPAFAPKQIVLLHNAIGAAIRGLWLADSRRQGINVLYVRKQAEEKKKSWWKRLTKEKSPASERKL